MHITAEYMSRDERLNFLLFHYVKSSRDHISAPAKAGICGFRHLSKSSLKRINRIEFVLRNRVK